MSPPLDACMSLNLCTTCVLNDTAVVSCSPTDCNFAAYVNFSNVLGLICIILWQ